MRYGGYTGHHKLYVVRGKDPPLYGQDWPQHLRLDWTSIRLMAVEGSTKELEELTAKYLEVIQEGLGTMKDLRAHLHLRECATPHFCRPRSVSLAIKEAVGRKLDQLEAAEILQKVDHSDWAAPILLVLKKDGTL